MKRRGDEYQILPHYKDIKESGGGGYHILPHPEEGNVVKLVLTGMRKKTAKEVSEIVKRKSQNSRS